MRTVRVTEVLDYFKHPWYVKWVMRVGLREANRVSKQALKIGTRIDEVIKSSVSLPLATLSKKDTPEVFSCLKAYEKWRVTYTVDHEPSAIAPLSPIVSKVSYAVNYYGISTCKRVEKECCGILLSGEPDFIALGRLTDLKAAKKVSPSYWLQLAAYAWLTDWQGEVAILRLDKTTESYEYLTKRLVDEWDVFRGLLMAYVYFTEGDEDDGDIDVREGDRKETVA